MRFLSQFFFVLFPYMCLAVMIAGHFYRYFCNPGGWNARSSEIFENRRLKIGSLLFHYGIILAFFGHFFGLLTPDALVSGLGIPDEVHMAFAKHTGRAFLILVLAGLPILIHRRLKDPRVAATSRPADMLVLLLILASALLAAIQLFILQHNVLETVAPWIRSIVIFNPQPELMDKAPFILKLHVVVGFIIFALYPFTRLVHIASVPVVYLTRPFIIFRRRDDCSS